MSQYRHNKHYGKSMQMNIKKGNIPLYFQLYLSLKADIILKKILPGERLPTTEELRIEHGIANHTVRKALLLLKEEGLITQKTKAGISVSEDAVINLGRRIETIIDGRLQAELEDGQPKKLSSCWAAPPTHIASIFWKEQEAREIESVYTAKILLTSKKSRGNKRLATVYVPAIGFSSFDLDENRIIQEYLSIPPVPGLHYRSELRPWLCDGESAELLGIADGTPVFFRTLIVRNSKGDVIFVSEGINTAGCLIEEYDS
ncbi:MAG: GntR family transcriptional regulator [Proteobacteria bacterium]|nr:GntR family transcriptional regulator [Pseudomonadota bacterium]